MARKRKYKNKNIANVTQDTNSSFNNNEEPIIDTKNEKNINNKQEIDNRQEPVKTLEEQIKDLEAKQFVERTYLTILEDNVREEKKKYQQILDSEIEIMAEFKKAADKKAAEEVADKIKELENARAEFFRKQVAGDDFLAFKRKEYDEKYKEFERTGDDPKDNNS